MKASLADLLARLPLPATAKWPGGVYDIEALRHGSMSLEVFAPRGADHQTPHSQDELYLVVSGTGRFSRDGEIIDFMPGDALFVPAHMPHRFESFTEDLVTWVVFWGPQGGEKATG
jgi:mannose-6-phosphate isomerase-like protein (cupin superfamily)